MWKVELDGDPGSMTIGLEQTGSGKVALASKAVDNLGGATLIHAGCQYHMPASGENKCLGREEKRQGNYPLTRGNESYST